MLASIAGFLIVISVIIFIHEFGHYYTARICGVKVLEFSFGFGRVLFARVDKLGTSWTIRAFPLGGFVKMYGDRNATSLPDQMVIDSMTEKQKKQAFATQSILKRAFIIAAGPIANFVLAVVIFSGLYFVFGQIEVRPIVGQVLPSSPAYIAGINQGDLILKVGPSKIKDFHDLRSVFLSFPNKELDIEVQRKGEIVNLKITPILKNNRGFVGIAPDLNETRKINIGPIDSILLALSDTYVTTITILGSIGDMLFNQEDVDNIGGVISVAKESGNALSQGSLLFFIAFLSINIGLMNLLPVPILDGGHLLFLLYEGVMGKKITGKLELSAYFIGGVVIIFLIVISTLNDIKSLLF